MRSRVLGAALFGLGVLALVFAGGLAFVVAPTVEQLPYDLKPTQSVAVAPNARFLQITAGKAEVVEGVELRSTISVTPDAKATSALSDPLDGEAVVWLVGQQVVRTDTNALISAYSTSLALDRQTAAAQPWDKAWLDTGNNQESVAYSGQIYKFPFGTEKKDYEIYDRDILKAVPAKFVKTQQIEGLETYQFTQEIRDEIQELPADRLTVLTSQLLKGGVTGKVHYSNTRTVWVEPATGQYLKVEEKQSKSLMSDDGQSVSILDATFTYTDDTIKSAAETSGDNRQKLQLVGVWAPIGLAVLGAVLIIAALFLLNRRPAAPAAPAPAHNPRHSASGAADDTTTEVDTNHDTTVDTSKTSAQKTE
ncbi:DUF3068 domain-containing protein [Paractinoplanes hotanensis]|uniref:DUF3068 domain-containing protein n=1 Tax=Paractinoplanes hotanensis TaxID=2906497 RepID=A0ABT0YB88_9ACTN|nr:DUF3068 domain-containing protein [Actinoplanes hotanensis]MCM4082742.1 DUF3068 domain-containing protein [Actinoplanes hotanensis]